MLTRYNDAKGIVGEELAKQIEEEYQKERREKSVIDQTIVYKSETDESLVDKITENLLKDLNAETEIIKSDLAEWEKLTKILAPNHFPILFSKMEESGKITTDELSSMIQTLLNEITPRSETIEKCEEMANPVPMQEKPFGDAKSLNEAEQYRLNKKIEWNAETLYYDFKDIYNNIMSDDEMDMNGKVSAVNSLMAEFQKAMNPKHLAEMSEIKENNMEKQEKSEVEVAPVNSTDERLNKLENLIATLVSQPAKETSVENESPELKSIVTDFKNRITEAVNKSRIERESDFQNILNDLGNQLTDLNKKLNGPEIEQKSEVGLQEVSQLIERTVNEKFGLLNAQIGALTEMLKTQNTQVNNLNTQVNPVRPVPVMKNLTQFTAPPQSNSKGFSIMELVKKTTF